MASREPHIPLQLHSPQKENMSVLCLSVLISRIILLLNAFILESKLTFNMILNGKLIMTVKSMKKSLFPLDITFLNTSITVKDCAIQSKKLLED